MTGIDARPAAEAEAENRLPGSFSSYLLQYKLGWCDGAQWAADRLPGREEIAARIAEQGWTCEYHEPDPDCEQCNRLHLASADAVLALIREKFKEENRDE